VGFDAGFVDAGDADVGQHFDAQAVQIADGALGQGFGKRPQDTGTALEEQDARVGRLDGAKVAREDVVGQLAQGPGQLDARGTAANDDEREQALALLGVFFALGGFKRQKNAPPDFHRIVQVLEPDGIPGPVVMPKVMVLRARCDDQVVVRKHVFRKDHAACRQVEARDLGQKHGHVALKPKDGTDGRGDVGGGQARHGDLIQKRLKHMVIQPVYQRDADGRVFERLGRRKPAKTAADDDDVRDAIGHHWVQGRH